MVAGGSNAEENITLWVIPTPKREPVEQTGQCLY